MLRIRRATQKDCPSIARLHTRAVAAIATDLYTPEEIEAWAIPRSPDSYAESIRDKEFYIAEDDDRMAGFGVLNQATSVIEALYVSPDVTRRGVGLMVLEWLEQRARALGLESLSLNASLNAVSFYRRAGYVAQERSKYQLATGVEIACVPMRKSLKD